MSKISNEIESEFKDYGLAIAGFAAIFCAWIFWLGQSETSRWFCWILLGISLVIEIVLIRTGATVISHWIQRQFRPLHDLIILGGMALISVWWIHSHWTADIHNHIVYQGMILFTLAGHFYAHGD